MNVFKLMADACHDTRSANKFLKEHDIDGVRIQAIKHTETERRRMYGLYILAPDHYYRRIFQTPDFPDVIQALEFYYTGRKEESTMELRDLRLNLQDITDNKEQGKQDIVNAIGARHNINDQTVRVIIATANYTRNPVKIPASDDALKELDLLQDHLKKQASVTIRLSNPVVRPYAMISNGNLVSGISIKADMFKVIDSNGSNDNLFAD